MKLKPNLLKLMSPLLVLSVAHATATREIDEQIIKGTVDLTKNTITLPLRQGKLKDGRKVFYVVTNTDNLEKAKALGIGYAPSLAQAAEVAGTRVATRATNGSLIFEAGTVNFSPVRSLTPGDAPNAFPPKEVHAGAVADSEYSPFVKIAGEPNIVYNAPILAFDVDSEKLVFDEGEVDYTIVHDKVVSINAPKHTVTLKLTPGFASGKDVVYVSFDSNVEVAATMEASVFAPALENLKGHGVGLDIYALANGATGKDNPDRQGFNSALSGEGSPLNILDGLPTIEGGYSPLWDLNIGVFTNEAIAGGQQKLIKSGSEIFDLVEKNFLTGPGGAAFGPVGIEINCPVVAVLK
jgi:hypothetical protein